MLWPARENHPGSGGAGALHPGVDGSGAIITHALPGRRADRADPDRCDRRRSHERHGRWSRQSCPGGPGRWGAATPRQIMPATNGCVGRRATGSIRAVRWQQSRQRRRSASSATRMWGWGAWVGQHFGGVHACLTTAGAACRDEQPCTVGVVTQPHLTENPLVRECARRRSWRPRSRRARRTDRSR